MIMHMVMCLVCIWAYGAHVAMQVSDPEGYTKNSHFFLLAESEPQVNTIFRSRKMDCRGIAYMYQDISTLLVAQTYGCSTHEAIGPVAAPLVSDRHHDKVKI